MNVGKRQPSENVKRKFLKRIIFTIQTSQSSSLRVIRKIVRTFESIKKTFPHSGLYIKRHFNNLQLLIIFNNLTSFFRPHNTILHPNWVTMSRQISPKPRADQNISPIIKLDYFPQQTDNPNAFTRSENALNRPPNNSTRFILGAEPRPKIQTE